MYSGLLFDPDPTTDSSGVFRHGNVTVFLLGSSVPGFNSQAQAVSGCSGSKDPVFSSQACNAPSEDLDWWNPEEWILKALKGEPSELPVLEAFS